jgi:adenosine deaminase
MLSMIEGIISMTLTFIVFLLRGDADAFQRVALEFCEDKAADGVAYVEARFNPHLVATPDGCDAETALKAAIAGFKEGEVRHIFSSIR